MKYNEFRALSAVLENNGASFNDLLDDDFILNEATPDEVDIKNNRDVAKSIVNPKYGLARGKLKKYAIQFMNNSNDKFINKYTNTHLGNVQKITNKMSGLKQDGRNPEEIVSVLQDVAKKSMMINEKQWKAVEDSIDRLEAQYNKRIDQIINNGSLTEKSKIKLGILWTMLLFQVKQKLYNNIISKQQEFVEKVTESNPEFKNFLNKITGGENLTVEMEKVKAQAEEEKKKYKAANAAPEEKEGETKTGDTERPDPQAGEKYKYTATDKATKKPKEITIDIVSDEGNGLFKVKTEKGTPFTIGKNQANWKKLGDKIETEAAQPAANKETPESNTQS